MKTMQEQELQHQGQFPAAAVLAIGTYRAKSKGASVASILGATGLMMPNCARKPQLLLTILTTAAVTGLSDIS